MAKTSYPVPKMQLSPSVDRFGRITAQTWEDYFVPPTAVQDIRHGYDAASNRIYVDNKVYPNASQFYLYDGLNRLINFKAGVLARDANQVPTGVDNNALQREQGWTMSQLGNTTNLKDHGVANWAVSTFNFANEIVTRQLDGQNPVNFTYDAAGNLTFDGEQEYTYDAWNRQVAVKKNNAVISTSSYDGFGRRVRKQIINSGSENYTYIYHHDGQRVIEERNGSGQVLKLYTWGQQYIDELVRIRTRHGGARSFYVIQDANYNVLGLVNEFGRQVERYEYTPYGERTVYSYGVLLADTNGDGVVDMMDLMYLASYYMQPASVYPTGDLNDDGIIDMLDIDILSAAWQTKLPAGWSTDPLLTTTQPTSSKLTPTTPVSLNDWGWQGLPHCPITGNIGNRGREYQPYFGRFPQRDPINSWAMKKNKQGRYDFLKQKADWDPFQEAIEVASKKTGWDMDIHRMTWHYLEYADGMNLYQYLQSSPVTRLDPSGLVSPTVATAGIVTICVVPIFAYVLKMEGATNDKYLHCVASCRIAKFCGREMADIAGYSKETIDWILKKTGMDSKQTGWDWADVKANKDGLDCAPSPYWRLCDPFGITRTGVALFTSCEDCCVKKHRKN